MSEYVELHARSAFSFLQGASVPEDLATRSAELDQPALAILDHDNLAGVVRFFQKSKKLGTRATTAAEITATDGTRYPLLVANKIGYANLCRLITHMKMRAEKGKAAASLEDLAGFSEGLICLTGDEQGPLARAIQQGRGR